MASWYAPLVEELGLQQATRAGWPSGCFYAPPNGTCATALDVARAHEAAGAAEDASHSYRATCSGRDAVRGHSTFACHQLQRWYTPELARAVTRYASDDLALFGYAAWDGDGEYHPTSRTSRVES